MANMIEKNLGPVTAFGYAKKRGYKGTEEEFGAEQAEFAANARQVATDKDAVVNAVNGFDQTITDANNAINSAKTTAVNAVTAEGTAQKNILNDTVVEFVADRKQINQNKTDILTKVDKADIDAEMSDTSLNPVQNKIVKEYVDNLEGTYKLIERITVAEESIIQRTHDTNGEPYKFKAVAIKYIGQSGNSKNFSVLAKLGGGIVGVARKEGPKNSKHYWFCKFEQKNGQWEASFCKNSNTNVTYDNLQNAGNDFFMARTIVDQPFIDRIVTNDVVSAGDIIEIWGVRA